MRVELLTVGDELLLGFTVDGNSAFLAQELSAIGIAVGRRVSVGDDAAEITAAVLESLSRADGVIVTGGLGPTSDDVTRPGVAAAFGRRMKRNEAIVKRLEEMWRARGRRGDLPAANLVQALVPEGARIFPNDHGTAPGLWMERDDTRWAALLPGVPREMKLMFAESLRPLLVQRAGRTAVIRSLTVRTTGVPESQLPDMLGDLAAGAPAVSLAYLPSTDGVDLRLTVRGHPLPETEHLLLTTAASLRQRMGQHAYAEGGTDMAEVVVDVCRRKRLTLAVAESCTGGLLGARLTAVPGASDVFRGGVIAYDNDVKSETLGVPPALMEEHGAVSEPVAISMSLGARTVAGADLGVAITGIAGPTGGTAEKPVGTVWIALADRTAAAARHMRLSGDRDEIRHRATQAALDLIRRKLAG
jgi:nicotinamide-nucleotide amidase